MDFVFSDRYIVYVAILVLFAVRCAKLSIQLSISTGYQKVHIVFGHFVCFVLGGPISQLCNLLDFGTVPIHKT